MKPLHLGGMCPKQMTHADRCSACSWRGQQNMPDSSPESCPAMPYTTNTPESNRSAYDILPHPAGPQPPRSPGLSSWTTTSSNILTMFHKKHAFTSYRIWKILPRVCWIPKHSFLDCRNKLISHWSKCVDYNCFYFD